MILITGGTGFVGSHVLLHLLKNNRKVRAIYRKKHTLDKVKQIFSLYSEDTETLFNQIEWVEADLTDIPALTKAFEGVEYVYHCGAKVSFDPNDYHILRKTNIEGTANIVNLCSEFKVKKLCYVSSVATLGDADQNQTVTEETPWNANAENNVYAITKYGAEMEVWRGTQENVPAVIVNPSVIIGPGLWWFGNGGGIFSKIHKGLNHYTAGSVGLVDVNDVTACMIQLMESTVENQRYLLNSEILSHRELATEIAKNLNVTPPQKEVKPWMLQIAWRMDWLKSKLTGKPRLLSKQLAQTLGKTPVYSNKKIKQEAGFQFTPIKDSIKTTCELFLAESNH